ncbi:DUF4174 domain-containing protein [Halocynthiibacter namhaensis]|uniref:DUF4174 domain-containing protein n=1 Tax=Halocynthiibacter namhaensis TaxID=1290553 RepID=UPI0005797C13|nr:DUF4174 domain-containing protein [Halocynthiibacter namhaensis]
MKRIHSYFSGFAGILLAGISALHVLPTQAQDAAPTLTVLDASTTTSDPLLWRSRLIVVFADSPLDPRFTDQITKLEAGAEALLDRDVVVITDTDPAGMTELRQDLRPRGFMMVLIGKDGVIRLRKPFAWGVREISRSIDKIPLRQQEVRDRRTSE